ncbi:unnamed protein product [Diabrotica balteata]|uniref:Uncharacterized protein n=1 Tax=Diabrotica balteata TaxID=107213 RepID=A0A9N9XA56_DIABA|nr:unnamed protein product [Diabrotica balteata]
MSPGRLLVALATNAENCEYKIFSPSLLSLESRNNEPGAQIENSDVAKVQPPPIPSPFTSHQVLQEIGVNGFFSKISNVKLITEFNQRQYYISPMHSDQGDFDSDDSDRDPHFIPGVQSKTRCFELRPTVIGNPCVALLIVSSFHVIAESGSILMSPGRLLVALATNAENCEYKIFSPSLLSLESRNNEPGAQIENSDVAKVQPPPIPSPFTSHQVLQEIGVNGFFSKISNVKLITEFNQRQYYISPMHSDQGDFDSDDSDRDPHFIPGVQSKTRCFEV